MNLPRVITRGEVNFESKGNTYDGCMYSFTMKGPIDHAITQLEFFGPHKDVEQDVSSYEVHIEITEHPGITQEFGVTNYFMKNTKFSVQAERMKKFVVDLPWAVFIPARKWVQIRFQLEGPKTYNMKKECMYNLHLFDNEKQIRFDCLLGSGQLSDIHILV